MTNDPPRVLLNGCWDLAHVGHFNAVRQVARVRDQMFPGGHVIAGIHPNSEILRVKGGYFVFNEEEKKIMLLACKWVDGVVENVPYTPVSPSLLDREDVRCNVAVHGDDPVILADGTDMYKPIRDAGRYVEIRRSECISTTTLINRILSLGRPDRVPPESESFSATARRFKEFAEPFTSMIEKANRVVYVAGNFDLLHPGHVEVLKRAAACGDFLMVGVLKMTDATEVLTESERALSLLSCRYVDDVILSAPKEPSADFLRAFGIKVWVRIENHDDFEILKADRSVEDVEVAKIDGSDIPCTTRKLVGRVLDSRATFEKRNSLKKNPRMSLVENHRLSA